MSTWFVSGLQRRRGFQYFGLLCFWLFSVKTFKILFYNVSFLLFLSRCPIQMDRKFRARIMSLRCWVCVRRHLLRHRKDRRLSVDSQAESLEEVQQISTPSASPSDSTLSKETEKFVLRTCPWKWKPETSIPLSTSFPHTNKRMCLFKVGSREVGHKLNEIFSSNIP